MNMLDSSFLCLDIGTSCVRGIAHRVRGAHLDKSAIYECASRDTAFATKSVIDELEHQIGTHFESAYITGNFGDTKFQMDTKISTWPNQHKITSGDIKNQIAQITIEPNFFPMHIIPLRYDTPDARNIRCPVGYIDNRLKSTFGVICYQHTDMDRIDAVLRAAHIQPIAFFDSSFVQNASLRPQKTTTMFIDLGAEYTSVSIWTNRGPVWYKKIPMGGSQITSALAQQMNAEYDDAERIKRTTASLFPKEMDRFTPADTAYDFSRSDVNDIVLPALVDIVAHIKESAAAAIAQYAPTTLMLTGGASQMEGAREFFENTFSIPTQVLGGDATLRALSTHIWNTTAPQRDAYNARHERIKRISASIGKIFHRRKKTKTRFIPIMPSTLCFDMSRPETYSLFRAGGISMIHIDIMDGLYVERIAGSINELRQIRASTRDHLHVHLMTESPDIVAADAVAAGADTVIMSTNTSGLRAGLRYVRAAGRRAGVALNPESSVAILKPVLRDLDEVMVMTVSPGASGQEFQPECVKKISILAATRRKYNLKFIISVDGGINDKTAQMCWAAGADILVSGSYLSNASDFPLAVQSLLKKQD